MEMAEIAFATLDPDAPNPRTGRGWRDLPPRGPERAALEALAADIARHGLLQPPGVLPLADGRHRLVWGFRRTLAAWLAAGRDDAATLPVRVLPADLADADREILTWAENAFRKDAPWTATTDLVGRLQEAGWSQRRIAEATGLSTGLVALYASLVSPLRQWSALDRVARKGTFGPTHARQVADTVTAALARWRKAARAAWTDPPPERAAELAAWLVTQAEAGAPDVGPALAAARRRVLAAPPPDPDQALDPDTWPDPPPAAPPVRAWAAQTVRLTPEALAGLPETERVALRKHLQALVRALG